MTTAPRPSATEVAWAGRVWDASLGTDCEAFYWLAARYPDAARQFAALMWGQIGEAIQLEITANLLRLERTFLKAHR